MLNNLTRRTFLAASGGALVACPVWALTEAQARTLVDGLVAEINRVIGSGKSEAAMIGDFKNIFAKYGDVPIMAQYALGVDGRSASAAQKRQFGDVFAGYISRKYGKRFREFIGGRIEVKSARQIKAGYEIKTTAYLRGEAPFEVTFLVSDKSGRNLFYNMFIEGVNLLLTERTEIGSLLDRNGGNIDKMIADLARMG
ncbi:ABC transporter substrate-binding protein [Sulfitobacter pseudonitzschiae]|uniref:ABC transporter substrate-binding protein n=1 Tax=Pseudosulfitobacter pseudonitzschiae TaxID=1402135 RepID=A0A9Q2P118_9RHOB|nr:ABC transporter substrate-binding protein [Pseudosulfitobacter pseudonitzschiae]MBM2292440.1 ABC transporter substrate-binding protein [Pseudosulfitobacter pseudonitzschiae]MBM2297357.1 ABC transporter substrate-binding protein [Pseudosulfitobacter pseudonitzschiae]MBM2302271.1 ABC transporter substrate-binding protein [Pseudosulfitobacter pseudonitzschiae]MBM2312054.1 ABC transporter substrate-binding protein [Pseudosulfitobacter pseudonitzschiae]MBM2316967.1 ABC transporter substrate-bind